jgi:hypothetical protein
MEKDIPSQKEKEQESLRAKPRESAVLHSGLFMTKK